MAGSVKEKIAPPRLNYFEPTFSTIGLNDIFEIKSPRPVPASDFETNFEKSRA
jgi:hypothetical protein